MAGHPLSKVLHDVAEQDGRGKIIVGDIVKALESRGFGPLLFIPAFVMVTPVGAIPGMPSVLATLVILIAGQMLFGRQHPWVPGFIANLKLSTKKYKKSIEKAKPVISFIEKVSRKRLAVLTHDTAQRVIAFTSVFLACTVPPLEIVPFAVFVPGTALLLFSLGLILRDGLVTLLGFLVTLPVFYLLSLAIL